MQLCGCEAEFVLAVEVRTAVDELPDEAMLGLPIFVVMPEHCGRLG